jgi:hypothetical protein
VNCHSCMVAPQEMMRRQRWARVCSGMGILRGSHGVAFGPGARVASFDSSIAGRQVRTSGWSTSVWRQWQGEVRDATIVRARIMHCRAMTGEKKGERREWAGPTLREKGRVRGKLAHAEGTSLVG